MSLPLLISIAPSHYCEKARWALDRAGVKYTEQNYVPVFHSLRMALLGGGSTPALVAPGITLRDSTDILEWADTQAGPGTKLYPASPDERTKVEAWEELFDTQLGPATRRIAYFYVIDAPALFFRLNAAKLGAVQRTLFRLLQAPLRGLIRKGLRVNAVSKQLGDSALADVLAKVEAELADGRAFLVGDSFSAADLTFAALLSPVLSSETLGARRGTEDLSAMYPAAFAAEIAALRARPAGAFALRVIDAAR